MCLGMKRRRSLFLRHASGNLVFSSSPAAATSCFCFFECVGPFKGPNRIRSRSLQDMCGSTVHPLYPSGSSQWCETSCSNPFLSELDVSLIVPVIVQRVLGGDIDA